MSCCSNKTCDPQPPTVAGGTTGVLGLADQELVKVVTESYGNRALTAGNNPQYAENVAAAFGYSAEELQTIPVESHMGLSCGNPTGTAHLKEGERVLDLGSGGGIDIFLAAAKIGPTGQAIGLDGSEEMIALARRNASRKGLTPPHVSFVFANLNLSEDGDELPIESNSVDCVISNCVINLLPPEGKRRVFKEIGRVLKPGGRVVISDLVAKKPLPDELRDNLNAYVGCIAGATTEEEYRRGFSEAGFKDIVLVDKKSDLNVYWDAENSNAPGCCTSSSADSEVPKKPDNVDVNEWIASYQIFAVKPQPAEGEEVAIPVNALKRWWDAYPVVKSSPPGLTNDEVAALVRNKELSPDEFLVVDVRRNDHAGGHVRGSEQWPAQTFYDDLAKLYEKHKDTKKVIFYCQSSNGRGPRCAGWYQDYLDKKAEELGSGEVKSKAYVLQGGIKGWLAKFGDQEDLVDKD